MRMTTTDAIARMRSAPACAECNGDETLRSPTAPMRHALEYAYDCIACAAIVRDAVRSESGDYPYALAMGARTDTPKRDEVQDLRAELDQWKATSEMWRVAHDRWQDWATGLLHGLGLRPAEGCSHGDDAARVILASLVALPNEPSAEAINAARAASTILVLQGEPLPLSRVTVRAVLAAAYAAERGRK